MLGVELSTQTMHGVGYGYEVGKIGRLLLGTYIGSLECSTDGTADENLEGLLLGFLF